MPVIYHKEGGIGIFEIKRECPSWLSEDARGLFYQDDPTERWQVVADFWSQGEEFRDPLDLHKMRNGSTTVHLGEDLSRGDISVPFRNITHFANNGFSLDNPDVQTLYTANFVIGTRDLLRQAVDALGAEMVVLAPERGGRIMKVMLEAMGVPRDQMPEYRASRKQVGDHYTVAVNFMEPLITGKNVLFADDCLARVGSELVSYQMWESVFGQPETYWVVVGAGVRRSVYARGQMLADQGIKHRILVAAEANSMNEHDYLQLTPEEKAVLQLPPDYSMRVNDMGTAMSLVSAERQRETPLYMLLATSEEHDDLVLSESLRLIDQDNNKAGLETAANKIRGIA